MFAAPLLEDNLLFVVRRKNDERAFMNEIYAMQRANGDWFAFENHGRFRVPLFRSSQDAMLARLRNFGMLLFKPIALDARLLSEIVPAGAGSDVDFCVVKDPFASLKHGSPLQRSELLLLLNNPSEGQTVPPNGNGFYVSAISTPPQSECWN